MVVVSRVAPVSLVIRHAMRPGPDRKVHISDLETWFKPKRRELRQASMNNEDATQMDLLAPGR